MMVATSLQTLKSEPPHVGSYEQRHGFYGATSGSGTGSNSKPKPLSVTAPPGDKYTTCSIHSSSGSRRLQGAAGNALASLRARKKRQRVAGESSSMNSCGDSASVIRASSTQPSVPATFAVASIA